MCSFFVASFSLPIRGNCYPQYRILSVIRLSICLHEQCIVYYRVVCSELYVHGIILTVFSFLTVVYICNSFISIDVYLVFHYITVCACMSIDICGGNQFFVWSFLFVWIFFYGGTDLHVKSISSGGL